MALTSNQITVAGTETALNTTSSSRREITIRNGHATDPLFIGPTGLSTSTGFSLAAGASVTVKLPPDTVIYGIRGSNAITASVLLT